MYTLWDGPDYWVFETMEELEEFKRDELNELPSYDDPLRIEDGVPGEYFEGSFFPYKHTDGNYYSEPESED